jgi:hypothetical protein
MSIDNDFYAAMHQIIKAVKAGKTVHIGYEKSQEAFTIKVTKGKNSRQSHLPGDSSHATIDNEVGELADKMDGE